LRPRDPAVFKRHVAEFPALKAFTVEQAFGSSDQAQKTHFAADGTFDQAIIAAKNGAN